MLTVLLFGFGGGYLVAIRPAREFWERSLWRYQGRAFTMESTNAPASSLSLPNQVILEAVPIVDEDTFALRLRDAQGERWKRLLLPEQAGTNGITRRAWVRNLKLKSFDQKKDIIRVRFDCEWEWGGREGGLIFLNPDLSFREFGISW